MPVELSRTDARRIAVRAQGFVGYRSGKDPIRLHAIVERLGSLQIDAVNVLVRAHYLTAYSRVGRFNPTALDDLATKDRVLVEQFIHGIAQLAPVELFPVFRRLRQASREARSAQTLAGIEESRPGYVDAVLAEITDRGPLAFGDLSDPGRVPIEERTSKYAASSVAWHRWALGAQVTRALVGVGTLAIAGRSPSFEAQYDLTERVIPADLLALPVPSVEDAYLALVHVAARATGVGTVRDIAAHFHLPITPTRKAVDTLVTSGDLEPAAVQGWEDKAYLSSEQSDGSLRGVATLLSPFDPLLLERKRGIRLFDFEHVFEFYVPVAKRRYGYFVLPFLLRDRLVGRVDVSADRRTSVLVVHAAYSNATPNLAGVTSPLAGALRHLASWLGLEGVEVRERGDLAAPLRLALGG